MPLVAVTHWTRFVLHSRVIEVWLVPGMAIMVRSGGKDSGVMRKVAKCSETLPFTKKRIVAGPATIKV